MKWDVRYSKTVTEAPESRGVKPIRVWLDQYGVAIPSENPLCLATSYANVCTGIGLLPDDRKAPVFLTHIFSKAEHLSVHDGLIDNRENLRRADIVGRFLSEQLSQASSTYTVVLFGGRSTSELGGRRPTRQEYSSYFNDVAELVKVSDYPPRKVMNDKEQMSWEDFLRGRITHEEYCRAVDEHKTLCAENDIAYRKAFKKLHKDPLNKFVSSFLGFASSTLLSDSILQRVKAITAATHVIDYRYKGHPCDGEIDLSAGEMVVSKARGGYLSANRAKKIPELT